MVELVLDGVGGVLGEGVEAVGVVLHVLVGTGAVEAPGRAVVLPDEVIPAVGVDAAVGGELIVLRLTLDHGKSDTALWTHGAEDQHLAVVGDLIGHLVAVAVQDDELAGDGAIPLFQVFHLGNLNDLRDVLLGGVLHFGEPEGLVPAVDGAKGAGTAGEGDGGGRTAAHRAGDGGGAGGVVEDGVVRGRTLGNRNGCGDERVGVDVANHFTGGEEPCAGAEGGLGVSIHGLGGVGLLADGLHETDAAVCL